MIDDILSNEYTACALDPFQASRQEAEAVQQDREAAYRVMADAMPQIVWTSLPDGFRDYFNQRWHEHTALSLAQSEGSGWLQALHAEDRIRVREAWEKATQRSDPFQAEYRLYCEADGAYRWHLERALPLLAPDSTVIKWFGTCTDIEEWRQARSRNETLIQQLWRAMTETHHRVKNNLQLVTTMIEMQILDGEEMIPKERLHRLNAQVRTIAAIHDILTQNTRENVTAQEIVFKDVLDNLMPVYRQIAPQHEIVAKIADVRFSGKQSTTLALVINELISNGIKHGQSRVELSVSVKEGQVEVLVRDDGPGFPEGFDPQVAANTGLELIVTLVRWDLAGEVRFTNHPDGGAQVGLLLPEDGTG